MKASTPAKCFVSLVAAATEIVVATGLADHPRGVFV